MKTKYLLILALIIIVCLSLTACSNDSQTTTQSGIYVAGRIICDGEPLQGVGILNGYTLVDVTDQTGIFVLHSLSEGDIISFTLDGYVFNPSTYTVSEDVYGLRIIAVKTNNTPSDNPSSSDEPTTQDEPDTPDTPDEPYTPDEPDTPSEPDTSDEPIQPDEPEKVYNCTNGGLYFQNDTIKFAFCVENNFSSLIVYATIGNQNVDIDTSNATQDIDETSGKTQVVVDITSYIQNVESATICATVYNSVGESGTSTSVVFVNYNLSPMPSSLSLTDGVLHWTCSANATYTISINDVFVGSTSSTSFDLNSLLFDGAQISVYSYVDGCLPCRSDTYIYNQIGD